MSKFTIGCRRISNVSVISFLFVAVLLSMGPSARAQDTSSSDSQNSQSAPAPQKKSGLWSKLAANAKYQQAKQNGDPNANSYLPQDSGGGSKDSKKHLCNINDPGVSLQPDGSWKGPNCVTSDGNGHAKNPDDMKDNKSKSSDDDQAKKAADMESHSCMTTDGADKANELADDCKKVADHPDKACNIQQNSCNDIKKATQKGCWGKGAEGPDFCLTKYR